MSPRFAVAGLALLVSLTPAAAGGFPVSRLADTAGRTQDLAPPGVRAVAVVFLNPDCPVCQRYAPALNRLAAEADPKAVRFLGVVSGSSVTRADAAKYAAEYKLTFPVLFDAAGHLAGWLKPTHVPEAFVLTAAGDVAYHGRIDDWYAAPGQARAVAVKHDLANALAAVLAGKAPDPARTKPVGCLFEDTPTDPKATPAKVTFNRHVAPVLFAQCASCHRPGEVAPFPLLTYQDAKKRAKQLAQVVRDRTMPPWKPAPDYGHFLDERRLTDEEIALVTAWAEADAPEGDAADLPPAPTFPDGWQLGTPDLVVKMPEPFKVPASGPDVMQNFVIPLDVPEGRMVVGFEFRPGNRKVVHHAICLLDSTGTARRLQDAERGPGYLGSKKGLGFVPSGGLGWWAPGLAPRFVPEGTGRYLMKGADVVLQVHYHPSGKEETDQSEFAVYFARKPGAKFLGGFAVESWVLDIPPGEPAYRRSAEYTLPVETTLIGAVPHMHWLGKEMKVWAERPDGKTVPLLHIPRWDFNWQDYYVYREPVTLPKGTKVKMDAWFDNSSGNPANPSRPPRRVGWGEGTADEMCLCVFEVTCPTSLDVLRLGIDNITERKLAERSLIGPRKK